MQVAPSWKKKLSVYIGVAAIVLVKVVLMLLSLLFAYDLKLVHKRQAPAIVWLKKSR